MDASLQLHYTFEEGIGTTTAIGTNETLTLQASGADLWGNYDEGTLVYKALRGDGSIVARVSSLSNTDAWAKAGVMIRESLAAGSKHAFMLVSAANGTAFQRRTSTGGSSSHTAGPVRTVPTYVKLVRTGNLFEGFSSADGVTWDKVGEATIAMGTDVYIGLAVTSHQDGLLSKATFDHVALTGTLLPEEEYPPTGLLNELGGRLVRMEDPNGYGTNLTYKYNPAGHPETTPEQQAAIAESTSRQWQIHTIADPGGRTLQYSYHADQVSGRWVVSQILLPTGGVVGYTYADGRLSQVSHPDGTTSTFTAAVDPVSQCTVIQYNDSAAEGTHRRKKAYLTNNFAVIDSTQEDETSSVWNSAAMMARMVVNGSGEVGYLNASSDQGHLKIYEGGGKLKYFWWGQKIKYYKEGWQFNPEGGA